MKAKSFKIKVSQTALSDLRKRLANTHWPDEVEGADWNYSTNLAYREVSYLEQLRCRRQYG